MFVNVLFFISNSDYFNIFPLKRNLYIMGIFQCITIYYIVLQCRYLPHIQVIISNNLHLTSISTSN
ncbi:hypothetical protein F9000_07585 [Bacteroides fragilis]|uniref:Transmembrane protein n=1 Tax=Bacteroides fragilis TaxID=817 RepID=A0A5C6JM32_BACFG|nr:hypothetical protein HMPREF0101_02047 [Bacteroides fragilis]KAB5392356.1 hypothetical protein F9Z90_04235 [Bacteroides fragilis]KAB5422053.1 hypothetical protein F9000_07585 [Bacteroides fragilis]KAB5430924.1 hypothetical protein F9Z99_08965 [Bacteroides fragilis]RGJ10793.1 hypothetical protein DXD74_20735 [Bacteroides fragilis]